MKKKSKLPIILFFFFLLVTNGTNYWYFNMYCEKLYKKEAEALNNELSSYKENVYVATADIPAGAEINMDSLVLTEGYVSSNVGLFKLSDLNKTAIANIKIGTILYANMSYDKTIDSGNTAQYSDIEFPSNATVGNSLDIRIAFRNGTDYVVISKTRLTGIAGEKDLLLTLTEEERQYLSSAKVDVKNGGKLYATIYSSPETQERARVTYIPSETTLLLLYETPSQELIKAREIFEKQIGGKNEE